MAGQGTKGGGSPVQATVLDPNAPAPAADPAITNPSSGQGIKGGGIAQPATGSTPLPPPLTENGTFFDENGVEMTPQLGLGGAPAVPTASLTNTALADASSATAPASAPAPTPNPGFNVNQAAATGLQNAMASTQQAMTGPLNVGAYMNPYQQQVIDNTQNDIERQRQMAMNTLGAQATRANAFGGSRQGVAEGVTNAEYGRMAANAIAPIRMQGYNTAMSQAMADRTARLGAANQLGSMAGQAFNTGRAINQDLMQQGLLQQSLQQALIDAAKTDFTNYANAPMASLSAPLAAVGASNMGQQTQTTQNNPGILGTLGALKYLGFPF